MILYASYSLVDMNETAEAEAACINFFFFGDCDLALAIASIDDTSRSRLESISRGFRR